MGNAKRPVTNEDILGILQGFVVTTNDHFEKLDTKVDRLEENGGKLDKRIGGLETRVGRLETSVSSLATDMRDVKQTLFRHETSLRELSVLTHAVYNEQRAMHSDIGEIFTHLDALEAVHS